MDTGGNDRRRELLPGTTATATQEAAFEPPTCYVSTYERLFAEYGVTTTPDAIAKRVLHMHPSTCRRLLAEGKIPGVKVGKTWVIPTAGLAEFLDGCGILHGSESEFSTGYPHCSAFGARSRVEGGA